MRQSKLTKSRTEAESKHDDIMNRFETFENKVVSKGYDLTKNEMDNLLDEIIDGL